MSSRITVGCNEKAAWILTNTQACIPARTPLCLTLAENHKKFKGRGCIMEERMQRSNFKCSHKVTFANNNGKLGL